MTMAMMREEKEGSPSFLSLLFFGSQTQTEDGLSVLSFVEAM
jgi:hypothetical protein